VTALALRQASEGQAGLEKEHQLKVCIARRGGWRPRLCWNAFWAFCSRRRYDTYRRTFPTCFYGPTHAGTKCLVHVEMADVVCSVRLDFVVVAHWCIPGSNTKVTICQGEPL
jgi:hypothetical protein